MWINGHFMKSKTRSDKPKAPNRVVLHAVVRVLAWVLVLSPVLAMTCAVVVARAGASSSDCHIIAIVAMLCAIPCVIGQVILWPHHFDE